MDELSTAPVQAGLLADEHGHPRANAAPRRPLKPLQTQSSDAETQDPENPAENHDPEHNLDISA